MPPSVSVILLMGDMDYYINTSFICLQFMFTEIINVFMFFTINSNSESQRNPESVLRDKEAQKRTHTHTNRPRLLLIFFMLVMHEETKSVMVCFRLEECGRVRAEQEGTGSSSLKQSVSGAGKS